MAWREFSAHTPSQKPRENDRKHNNARLDRYPPFVLHLPKTKPKPETRNPKPETLNPCQASSIRLALAYDETQTRNPKPETLIRERHSLLRWAKAEKIANNVEKLHEANVTTLRRVQLARSCARGGETWWER